MKECIYFIVLYEGKEDHWESDAFVELSTYMSAHLTSPLIAATNWKLTDAIEN